MGTLLIVAADAREFAGLRRRCRRETRLKWPLRFARAAELNGRRVVLVANGEGAALAGEACEVAWNKQRAEAILSTGFCGALDPALGAGEVLVASRVEAPGRDVQSAGAGSGVRQAARFRAALLR